MKILIPSILLRLIFGHFEPHEFLTTLRRVCRSWSEVSGGQICGDTLKFPGCLWIVKEVPRLSPISRNCIRNVHLQDVLLSGHESHLLMDHLRRVEDLRIRITASAAAYVLASLPRQIRRLDLHCRLSGPYDPNGWPTWKSLDQHLASLEELQHLHVNMALLRMITPLPSLTDLQLSFYDAREAPYTLNFQSIFQDMHSAATLTRLHVQLPHSPGKVRHLPASDD
jgi:hypothetical protein